MVIIFIVGYLLLVTAFISLEDLMIGRMFACVGVVILSVGVPLFMSETSPKVSDRLVWSTASDAINRKSEGLS